MSSCGCLIAAVLVFAAAMLTLAALSLAGVRVLV